MAGRKHNVPIYFMVSKQEYDLIRKKMIQYGARNMGAYLRKMAINGYVIRLDLNDVTQIVAAETKQQQFESICQAGSSDGTNLSDRY